MDMVRRLDDRRKELRLSYGALGEAAGISEPQARKILQGKDNKVLTVDALIAMSQRLGIAPESLVREAVSPPRSEAERPRGAAQPAPAGRRG